MSPTNLKTSTTSRRNEIDFGMSIIYIELYSLLEFAFIDSFIINTA